MDSRLTRRSELLTEAERIITQDRNKSYGEPDEDFQRIARIATAMGFRVADDADKSYRDLSGDDVAKFMIALKLSRLMWSPEHRDSWLDVAGYAACGFETAALQAERRSGPAVEEATTDRERLRNLTGHGWDGCAICVEKVSLIAKYNVSGRFDWGNGE